MAEPYPCRLPNPLVASNSYSTQNLVDRNDLSSGPPIFRLRSASGWVQFDIAFSYDALEMQVFNAWFRNTLINGSKSFTIELMVDGFDGEKNTKTHECYFEDSPTRTQNGNRWRVSARVIAIEQITVDECDTASLLAAFNGFNNADTAIVKVDDISDALDGWAV